MTERVVLVTGSRKGIGRGLCEHYLAQGFVVHGCSREPSDLASAGYTHHCLDVTDEAKVAAMMSAIRHAHGGLYAAVNNAGVAAMNHVLLTPLATVRTVFETNVLGTFLVCREAAKLMRKGGGRIVNFATVATPLNLEGEAAYAASKAAVESLTRVMSREFAALGVTVNAVGPTPVPTDLIRSVPAAKMQALIARQAIPRMGELRDVINVIDFFLRPESDFITGQTLYLGGVI
ncbi:MAG: Short-chain dehydrogenase/reductase [Myxococcaceae bacterium]|nr:Short-chain dehydrogenase/reductase [Myxococcaceae bacterium]